MAICLKVSHNLTALAHAMIEQIRLEKIDIFTPYSIVTQTEGMNIWLKQQIANKCKIAANVDFLKPNDIIYTIYKILGGEYKTSIARENIVWVIFQILDSREFKNLYPIQASYYTANKERETLSRMNLAEKLADVFDQYQIYRTQWIVDWNKNSDQADNWQAYIWNKVKKITHNTVPDKTDISEHIKEQLKIEEQRKKLQDKLPAVYLFGLSIFTNYHLDLFKLLSRTIDIYFYILNPSPEIYWVEDKSEEQVQKLKYKKKRNTAEEYYTIGNSLLTNWGKILQQSFALIYKNEEAINSYDIVPDDNSDIRVSKKDATLLHRIQKDIYDNSIDTKPYINTPLLTDGSITIHAHYTILGEVESLYNYLVKIINNRAKKDISPRDIIVMVNDIDKYAPYIHAVFSNVPYPIKYQISDISINNGDTIFNAIDQILSLNENNFTSEAIVQLLEFSCIRNKFQLQHIDLIRNWIAHANIRFGIDGSREDDTNIVSWEYGLKRLMFGICMTGEPQIKENDGVIFYPLDIIEGNAREELIRFVHFVHILTDSIRERNYKRSVEEWIEYTEYVIDNLFYLEEVDDDARLLGDILIKYVELNKIESTPLFDEKIEFSIFKHNFSQNINSSHRSSLFINGGITFCSLIPMRSIPFKIIAMLGLNKGSFPRSDNFSGLNLMLQQPHLGDRSVKDNDKQLFLETIISATDYLFLSYIGFSEKNKTETPPSILVDELIDYIQKRTEPNTEVKKSIVTNYPLQPFSNRYNDPERPNLIKFGNPQEEQTGTILLKTEENTYTSNPLDIVQWKDVKSFYKNAIVAYFNKTLGIYYNDNNERLEETEIFNLDHLSKWTLKSHLWTIQSNDDLQHYISEQKLKGYLPLKNIAAHYVQEEYSSMSDLINEINALIETTDKTPKDIECIVKDATIIGHIDALYGDTYLNIHLSSKDSFIRSMLQTYLDYILLRAQSEFDTKNMYCILYEKDALNIQKADTDLIDQTQASLLLAEIIELFQSGLNELLLFEESLYKKIPDLGDVKTSFAIEQIKKSIARQNTRNFYLEKVVNEYDATAPDDERIKRAMELVVEPLRRFFPNYKF